MASSQDKSIAHYQFRISHCLAEWSFPNPSPCKSMCNARCAMVNEIQTERLILMPLSFKSRAKLTRALRRGGKTAVAFILQRSSGGTPNDRLMTEFQTYFVCGETYFTTGSSANAASFSIGNRPMITFDDCGSRITSKPSFFNRSIVAADLSASQT